MASDPVSGTNPPASSTARLKACAEGRRTRATLADGPSRRPGRSPRQSRARRAARRPGNWRGPSSCPGPGRCIVTPRTQASKAIGTRKAAVAFTAYAAPISAPVMSSQPLPRRPEATRTMASVAAAASSVAGGSVETAPITAHHCGMRPRPPATVAMTSGSLVTVVSSLAISHVVASAISNDTRRKSRRARCPVSVRRHFAVLKDGRLGAAWLHPRARIQDECGPRCLESCGLQQGRGAEVVQRLLHELVGGGAPFGLRRRHGARQRARGGDEARVLQVREFVGRLERWHDEQVA